MSDRPIDEAEFLAWIDGRLDAERAGAVQAAVEADPELAARANSFIGQNRELRRLFGSVAEEPLPPRLRVSAIAARRTRRRRLVGVAAAVAWLAIGAGGGWLANNWLVDTVPVEAARHVARAAVSAHRVYAVEVRHPVEVFADQEAHLVKWLSNRLGHDIRTPDLGPLGFKLVGGRLLPTEEGQPAAQFLYEDRSGRRVSVYVSLYESGRETAFRYQEMNGAGAFVWLEPDLGYAIVGDVPRELLLEVSKRVYDTFETTR